MVVREFVACTYLKMFLSIKLTQRHGKLVVVREFCWLDLPQDISLHHTYRQPWRVVISVKVLLHLLTSRCFSPSYLYTAMASCYLFASFVAFTYLKMFLSIILIDSYGKLLLVCKFCCKYLPQDHSLHHSYRQPWRVVISVKILLHLLTSRCFSPSYL